MGETSTLNLLTNQNDVKKAEINENLDADDLVFYHSLRNELDQLSKTPKLQIIHHILDYSKSLR